MPRPIRHDTYMRFRMPFELRDKWKEVLPLGQSSRLVRAFMNRLLEEVAPMDPAFQDTFLFNIEMGNFSLIRGILRRPITRPRTMVAKSKELDFGTDETPDADHDWRGDKDLRPKWW